MGVFHSLAARITLVCVGLVLVTAVSLVLFAHRGTVSALRTVERRSLDNILYLVERELALLEGQAESARQREILSLRESLRARALSAARARESLDRETDRPRAALVPEQSVGLSVFRRKAEGWADAKGRPLPDEAGSALASVAPGGNFGLVEKPGVPASAAPAGIPPSGQAEAAFFLPFADAAGHGVLAATAPLPGAGTDLARRQEAARAALEDLLRHIRIQRTGFLAVIDGKGRAQAATAGARLPPELTAAAIDPQMAKTGRRVMILPDGRGAEILYLLGWFRPYDWHVILAAPLDELEAPAVDLVAEQLLITLLVSGLAILAGLAFSRFVAAPVRRLALFARRLPEENMLELEPESFTASLPPAGKGEVGELSGALRYMTSELSRNVKELVATTALRQRLEGELVVARDIQYGMLPTKFPHGDGFASAAAMLTAKEVGGDLYDFFYLDNGRLCFVIGDVSDKGIPAALFMSMAVTLVRAAVRDAGLSAQTAMARINDALSRDNPRNMFVTLIIGVFDPATGDLAWASGGHLPPVALRRKAAESYETEVLPSSGDMVVGSFDGLPYKLLTARLEPGDTLVLYTDGVTEAMDPVLEQYGEARLLALLASGAALGPQPLIDTVLADVAAHAAGAGQSDDITLLAIHRLAS